MIGDFLPLRVLLALMLALPSATALASSYEVKIVGEAPAIVMLDNSGQAWLGSKASAFDVPAVVVKLESLTADGGYLKVTTHITRPAVQVRGYKGSERLVPVKYVRTLEAEGDLRSASKLKVFNHNCQDAPTCPTLVTIRRQAITH